MTSEYDWNKTGAEELVQAAAGSTHGSDRQRYLLDAAQVYATLALAVATREPYVAGQERRREFEESIERARSRVGRMRDAVREAGEEQR